MPAHWVGQAQSSPADEKNAGERNEPYREAPAKDAARSSSYPRISTNGLRLNLHQLLLVTAYLTLTVKRVDIACQTTIPMVRYELLPFLPAVRAIAVLTIASAFHHLIKLAH